MTDHKDILDAPESGISVKKYLKRSFIIHNVVSVVMGFMVTIVFLLMQQIGLLGAVGLYPILGTVLILGLFVGFFIGVKTLIKINVALPLFRVLFQMVTAYLIYIGVFYASLVGIEWLLWGTQNNGEFFLIFGKYLLGTIPFYAIASFLFIKRISAQLIDEP